MLGRSEWARAKAADEAVSAWRRRVRDGLTSGGSAGVRPPLGVFGLTPVGHVGLNPNAIRASEVRLTASFSPTQALNP